MPMGINHLKTLRKRLQKIYDHYPITSRIKNSDDLFLRELMRYHPIHNDVDNIKYFVLIRQSRNTPELVYISKSPNKGFYNKYLKQHVVYCNPLLIFTESRSQIYKVNKSFRNAIKKNLVRSKKVWFGNKHINYCQLSGLPMTFRDCSVHHLYSFSNLVKQFLNDYAIDIKTLEFTIDDYGYHLKNKTIEQQFIKYHNSHAHWIFIDSSVHDIIHSAE
jgi:cytochrome b involved in lipid metabolism